MTLKRYIRQHIYRWHRITSLIVAIPILLWTLSGFLHPVLNSFKPGVANQYLAAPVIDTSKIKLSLKDALILHRIKTIHNFRIVKLSDAFYYQIQHENIDTLTYISCYNGQLLFEGDKQYAAYLAKKYLSEPDEQPESKSGHPEATADVSNMVNSSKPKKPAEKINVPDVELIKKFSSEYKRSNVLLPVYKVQFNRSDGIRLYIETSTDRLATAIDNKKAWFTRFFAITHSWSFLDGMGITKHILPGMISLLCFISSFLGFYVYNNIKRKKTGTTAKSWHRVLGNVFVLTTMLFAFSGAWHAFHKLSQKPEGEIAADHSQFSSDELDLSLDDLSNKINKGESLTNISIVKMDNENYWQLFTSKRKEKQKRYISTKTFKELPDGDNKYGCYLACLFANKRHHSITHSKCLTEFTDQYSMMNKRLPVIEVGIDGMENYYVETSTGKLSAVTNALDKAERFSFSNLHMHHYWEMWMNKNKGKTIRNTVLISSTLGLLLLAITGTLVFIRKRRKRM